ncbi:hypothetical protein [Nocardioides ferulae]|uniref:hypothetical protein n=1 Tax=Nocardioides ferulae TaxID=2340821 RepID=UPI000EACF35D|nr:hypothetical protein [Nocardioides ferulae]
MTIGAVLLGPARWCGPEAGETTRATGVQLGRGLAVITSVVAALCAWSVLVRAETRPTALLGLGVFTILTADLATSPLRARHAAGAVAGLAVSWGVADPTGSGGVYPNEIAMSCALMACVGVFAGPRAWCWIAAAALLSLLGFHLADGTSTFRGPGIALQVAMAGAAQALGAALHETVRRTDQARERHLAELVAGEVARRELVARGEAVAVLHDAVSDALRLASRPAPEPDRVREACAAAYDELRKAARWQTP